MFLVKSTVKGHTRKTKTGRTTVVKTYTTSKTKKPAQPAKPRRTKIEPIPVAVVKEKGKPAKVVLSRIKPKVVRKKQAGVPQKVAKTKLNRKGLAVGVDVMFKPEGANRMRRGVITKLGPKRVEVAGRRQESGEVPIYRMNTTEVMSVKRYKEAQKRDVNKDPKITTQGDRTKARYNLTPEELERRRVVLEKRLKMSEADILNHHRVKGAAFKIVSELAKENNISVQMTPATEGNVNWWHRAMDANYQEMLFSFMAGSMKSWRRELSRPYGGNDDKLVKKNVKEFKEFLQFKREKSYVYTTLLMDGKRATIEYLKGLRIQRKMEHGMDISDMEQDPEARKLLAARSTEPMQIPYAMQKRGETIQNDVKALLKRLRPIEREALGARIGMSPSLGEDEIPRREMVPMSKVAAILNARGFKTADGHRWTRNTVSEFLVKVMAKVKAQPEVESLKFWVSENMGRHGSRTGYSARGDGMEKAQEGESAGTICIDFDGVIAEVLEPFEHDVFGQPIDGAREVINKLAAKGWKIIIFTCRQDTDALRVYLHNNGIVYHHINVNPDQPLDTNHGKPMANVYLDDRARRFTDWGSVGYMLSNDMLKACPEMSYEFNAFGLVHLFPAGSDIEQLQKSYSKDLQKKHPGGNWVTIKEGPLAGRHIYILPHKDGTATVLAGGGPAMRHKILRPKEDKGKVKEHETDEKKDEKKKEKTKPKLTEKQEHEVKQKKKVIASEIKGQRKQMSAIIREKVGIETEVSDEEKAEIEKRIENQFKEKKKQGDKVEVGEEELAKMIEIRAEQKKKRDAMDDLVRDAKMYLLDEEVLQQQEGEGDKEAQERMSIAAAVKECAEELATHHYNIKALARERKELNRMIATGKSFDKFESDTEVGVESISADDLKDAVMKEHLRSKELEAHYELISKTRGIVGQGDVKKKLSKEMQRNLTQGGYEAVSGFVGGMTGSNIMTRAVYEELGSHNASILARHYMENSGVDIKTAAKELEDFINEHGNPVAEDAVKRGLQFSDIANSVIRFGRSDDDNLMSRAQAAGTALQFSNRAIAAYGQGEGALNQGAELMYALSDKKKSMEITANSKEAIKRKMRALGLKTKDVTLKQVRGEGWKMTVNPRSFEKLIAEKPTAEHGRGLGMEFSPSEIKDGKANTDTFHPSAIKQYFPERNGVSKRITPMAHQQSAARLVAAQKKVYLNHEAGTGKSFTAVLTKAHIEDTTGEKKKMVVAMPKKLAGNFKEEVEMFSNYNVVILATDKKKRMKQLDAIGGDPNTIVVMNKEKFNSAHKEIADYKFDMVVADEAHKISQREGRGKSQMSAGLGRVAHDAEYYIAMSGTPTPSDLSELYFHANIMNPEKFSNQKQFMEQFGQAHKGAGYKELIGEFLNTQLNDHVHTHSKKLDTKINLHRHTAKLTKTQKDRYRSIQSQYSKGEIHDFGRRNQIKSTLNATDWKDNGKFTEIDKIVKGHMATKGADEKVIFYAENYDTVRAIEAYLGDQYPAHESVRFTGSTKEGKAFNDKQVADNKQRFKHDPKVRFSIHTDAGVEGLNLQYDGNGHGATTAIAVGSGMNAYSTIDQFFSRANRTGALKDVDGHLILSDSPYDLATDVRLEEKKQVSRLIRNKQLGVKSPLKRKRSAA